MRRIFFLCFFKQRKVQPRVCAPSSKSKYLSSSMKTIAAEDYKRLKHLYFSRIS